jgi:hypothetical protein
MRVKMFAWLLLGDRLNTRDMLQHRHWHVTKTYDCVLCPGQHRETRDHLFFMCQFSSRVWNYLQIFWNEGDDMVTKARREFNQPFFVKVFLLSCHSIWKVRSAMIFDQVRPRFSTWKGQFVHDISLHAHRKDARKDKLLDWILHLP